MPIVFQIRTLDYPSLLVSTAFLARRQHIQRLRVLDSFIVLQGDTLFPLFLNRLFQVLYWLLFGAELLLCIVADRTDHQRCWKHHVPSVLGRWITRIWWKASLIVKKYLCGNVHRSITFFKVIFFHFKYHSYMFSVRFSDLGLSHRDYDAVW